MPPSPVSGVGPPTQTDGPAGPGTRAAASGPLPCAAMPGPAPLTGPVPSGPGCTCPLPEVGAGGCDADRAGASNPCGGADSVGSGCGQVAATGGAGAVVRA